MRNIKITIEYDGTNYCGWQRQANGLSVQGVIEKTLKKILGEKITLIGASRTDSGVHALGQVANFRTSRDIPVEKIKNALNSNLPIDIRISKIKNVIQYFNAQFKAKSKIYRYTIYNRREKSPFLHRFSYHAPYNIDIKALKKSASYFLGSHDFSSFKGAKGSTKSQVRTIKNISVRRSKDIIYISVEADGFLYNMVRNIAGTLIEAGRGKITSGDVLKIIKLRDRTKAGPTAPAQGLTLIQVKY